MHNYLQDWVPKKGVDICQGNFNPVVHNNGCFKKKPHSQDHRGASPYLELIIYICMGQSNNKKQNKHASKQKPKLESNGDFTHTISLCFMLA